MTKSKQYRAWQCVALYFSQIYPDIDRLVIVKLCCCKYIVLHIHQLKPCPSQFAQINDDGNELNASV